MRLIFVIKFYGGGNCYWKGEVMTDSARSRGERGVLISILQTVLQKEADRSKMDKLGFKLLISRNGNKNGVIYEIRNYRG